MNSMVTLAVVKDLVLDILLPQTCPACRLDVGAGEALCASCRPKLVPCQPPWCLRCAEPLKNGRSHCAPCSSRLFSCGLIRCAYLYRGPAPALVHAFKYNGRTSSARQAGRWMAEALERFPELKGFDALVPVPLHRSRLRERGYNQAELLAGELSQAMGLPVLNLIQRLAPTKPQWGLDRAARLRNLCGVFSAPLEAAGGRFLLIDDVCTSGTSLEGCAQALQLAGAVKVSGYAFARQTNV